MHQLNYKLPYLIVFSQTLMFLDCTYIFINLYFCISCKVEMWLEGWKVVLEQGTMPSSAQRLSGKEQREREKERREGLKSHCSFSLFLLFAPMSKNGNVLIVLLVKFNEECSAYYCFASALYLVGPESL